MAAVSRGSVLTPARTFIMDIYAARATDKSALQEENPLMVKSANLRRVRQ